MNRENMILHIDKCLQICCEERQSYHIWLKHLEPYNPVTIVAPAVLSVFAGSTILTEPIFLGSDKGRLVAGVCALTSAVLTTIHKVLNCDNYQAECRRIKKAYSTLETSYKNLRIQLDDDKLTEESLKKLSEEFLTLNARLYQIKEGAGAEPPDYCRKRVLSDHLCNTKAV
jgi:hypothetical protein